MVTYKIVATDVDALVRHFAAEMRKQAGYMRRQAEFLKERKQPKWAELQKQAEAAAYESMAHYFDELEVEISGTPQDKGA